MDSVVLHKPFKYFIKTIVRNFPKLLNETRNWDRILGSGPVKNLLKHKMLLNYKSASGRGPDPGIESKVMQIGLHSDSQIRIQEFFMQTPPRNTKYHILNFADNGIYMWVRSSLNGHGMAGPQFSLDSHRLGKRPEYLFVCLQSMNAVRSTVRFFI